MNIGIFTDSFTPEVNGVVTSLQLFITEFRRQGHTVFIFAPNDHLHGDYSEANTKKFPAILIFGKQFRLSLPHIETKEIKELNLDIIHIHTPGTIGIAGLRLAKKLKIPTVYTYHTCVEQYAQFYLHLPKWTENKIFFLTATNFYNKNNAIIAPSQGIKNTLQKFLKIPIEVIPTGVDVEKITNQAANGDALGILKQHHINSNDQLLITASRLGKEKNLEFIINSFPQIKKQNSNVKLLIVGSGPDENHLKTLAQNIDPKDIIFLGRLNQNDLFAIYQYAQIFLFASSTETQGLVVLEALTMNLPVVAIRATGVEDLLENNIGGLLVNNNKEEFANAVNNLLKDKKLLIEKKEQAQEQSKKFSIEKMAQKTLEIYQKLIISK